MARHEVPVATDLVFVRGVGPDCAEDNLAIIRFEGIDFGWHANAAPDPELGQILPTVTMPSEGDVSYRAEALVLQRFLSALSYALDVSVTPVVLGYNSHASDPLEPLMFRQSGSFRLFSRRHDAPREVGTVADDRLQLVLALHREGRSALSPFYRFLAYWNALDVVFDGNRRRRDEYLGASPAQARAWFHGWDPMPSDLADYFRESSRHAVAHAVRAAGRTVLDPDLPEDRERLDRDAHALVRLLRRAIEERWPHPVSAR